MQIKEQEVNIREHIAKIIGDYMDEGMKEGIERALLLLGKADSAQIKIEEVRKVPKENCGENRFTRLSEEEEKEIEEKLGKEKLGYVHLHPPSEGFQPFWLSKEDYTEMMKRDEKICAIAQTSEELRREVFVYMIIVFWGRDCPKPLPVRCGEHKSDYCLYLNKTWRILGEKQSA